MLWLCGLSIAVLVPRATVGQSYGLAWGARTSSSAAFGVSPKAFPHLQWISEK
jgi:hypothetical protein